MAAGLQLRDIGIAVRIVDELMMRDVLQTIVLRGAEKRKHAEPIGNEIVPPAILQQNVMRRFVGEARELMLPGADQDDGDNGDRDVPPERPIVDGVEPERGANDEREIEVGTCEVEQVGNVIGLPKRLQLLLDARIAQRKNGRRRGDDGGHGCCS